MALFKKKVCVICGKESGLLSRQKIANDDYICSECESKCGRLIFSSTFKQMTAEDVIRQQEETANNVEVLNRLFTETDFVEMGTLTGGKIISVDANHGWISIPGKDPKALFTFDQIGSVTVNLQTRPLPEEHGPQGPGPHGPQGHGPQGHGPAMGPQGHHAPRRMMPMPPAGFPMCPPNHEIYGIEVRVNILNSWIKWFDLDVMSAIITTDSDIIRGYQNASRVIELLNWCKNAQLQQNTMQAAVEQAASVAAAAAAAVAAQPQPQPTAASAGITADAIAQVKQLKELLDIGAISQEEFDFKKKQLLGL